MGLKKRTGATLTANVLLVLSGLVAGYLGHDFFANGPEHVPADASSRDGAVTLEPEADSAGGKRQTMLSPVSEINQRNEGKKEKAADRQIAGWDEQIQEPGAILEDETPDGFVPEPGVWDVDPNLDNPDDPDAVTAIMDEHDAAYLEHLQSVAESVASLHPPSWEPDEGELENLYGDLPEVGEQEALEMIEADEQMLSFQEVEPEPETLIPSEEELPPPAY